jgi:phosphatidylglycerophosphatase A
MKKNHSAGRTPRSARPPHKLAALLSTWFGCGYSPIAPGTAGSLAALPIAIALHAYAGFAWWHFLLLAAIGFWPAVWAAGVTARATGIEDPGFVVVDEVIGQWIALVGAHPFNWKSCLAAFALFRLFDIWKPPPVRQLEALPGGLGIVADDAMAGGYAALVLFLAGCFNLY